MSSDAENLQAIMTDICGGWFMHRYESFITAFLALYGVINKAPRDWNLKCLEEVLSTPLGLSHVQRKQSPHGMLAAMLTVTCDELRGFQCHPIICAIKDALQPWEPSSLSASVAAAMVHAVEDSFDSSLSPKGVSFAKVPSSVLASGLKRKATAASSLDKAQRKRTAFTATCTNEDGEELCEAPREAPREDDDDICSHNMYTHVSPKANGKSTEAFVVFNGLVAYENDMNTELLQFDHVATRPMINYFKASLPNEIFRSNDELIAFIKLFMDTYADMKETCHRFFFSDEDSIIRRGRFGTIKYQCLKHMLQHKGTRSTLTKWAMKNCK